MASATIGLLHPGDMGSMVGASARANGLRVLWASEGRSPQTLERAAAAGLEDIKGLAPVVAASQVILSVCPPHAAVDLAREVAAQGFSGIYVDGNAVSPQTGREIGRIVEKGGAPFVDGGIIGPPPRKPGTTRLYLSGEQAGAIARLFEKGPLQAIAIDGGPGAASALKMAYAAYTKGTSALLIAIRALAMQAGVDKALLDEWGLSQAGGAARPSTSVTPASRSRSATARTSTRPGRAPRGSRWRPSPGPPPRTSSSCSSPTRSFPRSSRARSLPRSGPAARSPLAPAIASPSGSSARPTPSTCFSSPPEWPGAPPARDIWRERASGPAWAWKRTAASARSSGCWGWRAATASCAAGPQG